MTMNLSTLAAQPHLSVITRHADYELARIQNLIEHKALVEGRGDLERLLGELLDLDVPAIPRTLDLIGHSVPEHSLLLLGDWVIDASSPTVKAFFRELTDNDVLSRLGISAVRLLGCETADTELGQSTICALSNIMGREVFGTTELIYSAHYNAHGFRDDVSHVLVSSSDLRGMTAEHTPVVSGAPYRRVLDIDSLPVSPMIGRQHRWPTHVATTDVARSILQLIRRSDGAQMPGLLVQPGCDVALPSTTASGYHTMQVLLGGEFVRVYPDGEHNPGVLFPVTDPSGLRSLVDALPLSGELTSVAAQPLR